MDKKNAKIKLDTVVGKNIRNMREEYRMTRDELAQLMGLTPSHMGLMERGERGATAINLSKLSRIFDKPVDHFFSNTITESGPVWSDEEPEAYAYKNKIRSIINLLPARKLGLVVHLIRGLVAMDMEENAD